MALERLEKSGESDCFNMGNEKGTSVLEVIEAIKKVTDKEFKVTLIDHCPDDSATLVGGSEKAKAVLGWEPQYMDIETIVRHAWEWHKKKTEKQPNDDGFDFPNA